MSIASRRTVAYQVEPNRDVRGGIIHVVPKDSPVEPLAGYVVEILGDSVARVKVDGADEVYLDICLLDRIP